MNRLPAAKRAMILTMLVEGSSMRSISRVADDVPKIPGERRRQRAAYPCSHAPRP